jgi:hypothetical protein
MLHYTVVRMHRDGLRHAKDLLHSLFLPMQPGAKHNMRVREDSLTCFCATLFVPLAYADLSSILTSPIRSVVLLPPHRYTDDEAVGLH